MTMFFFAFGVVIFGLKFKLWTVCFKKPPPKGYISPKHPILKRDMIQFANVFFIHRVDLTI